MATLAPQATQLKVNQYLCNEHYTRIMITKDLNEALYKNTIKKAFDHFNVELFNSQLPEPLFVLARKKNTLGYLKAKGTESRDGSGVYELALNPQFFLIQDTETILATLCHEAIHLWQHVYGKPSRNGYHNAEFADFSESLGLMPSSTGEPGGKRVGNGLGQYIIDGLFRKSAQKLISEGLSFDVGDRFIESSQEKEKDSKSGKRQKYECPACSGRAWGKPDLNLFCGCQNPPVLMNPHTLKQHPTPNPLKALAKAVETLQQQGQTDEEIIQGLKETPIFDCLDELNPLRPIIKEWLKTEAPRPAVTIRRVTVGKPAKPAEPKPEKITEKSICRYLKADHPEVFAQVGPGKKYPSHLWAASVAGLIKKKEGSTDFVFCE